MARHASFNPSTSLLKIMLFNVRSYSKNKANLFGFIRDLDQIPDLILLTETWITEGYLFSSPGYSAMHNCRYDGYGGVSVLVKNGIHFNGGILDPFPFTNAQFLSIKVLGITIIVAYVPPNVFISSNQWYNFLCNIESPYILTGDFNAHHQFWGNQSTCRKGQQLAEAIERLDLININDGNATLLTRPDQDNVVIDLVFCTADIAAKCFSNTLEDTLGSNHFPVLIKYWNNHLNSSYSSNSNPKFNTKYANWNKFSQEFAANFDKFDNPSYHEFVKCIYDSACSSIPFVSTSKHRYKPCPWWDDECTKVIKLRKALIKQYKISKTMDAFIIANRYIALSKRTLNKKKKAHFRAFCASVNRETPIGEVWKSVRNLSRTFFNNRRSNCSLPNAENFLDSLAPCDVPQDPTWLSWDIHDRDPLTKEISEAELRDAVLHRKNSTPGFDNINYPMLAHLPSSGIKHLMVMYNGILEGREIPSSWKKSIICPFLKPNKDPNNYRNFRPIALFSCIRKIFEKILKNRLEWWCEHHLIFDNLQFGFRRSKSTLDALSTFVADIYSAFHSRKMVLAVFLDLSSAYDNVIPEILLKKMKNLQIPTRMRRCIAQLVYEKKICIRNHISSRNSTRGLPQGSVLSPLLFNIYLAGLQEIGGERIKIIQYADDVIMYAADADFLELNTILTEGLAEADQWFVNMGLSISAEKSRAVIFSRKRNTILNNVIAYEGGTIRIVPHVKYLGMYLDRKLNWKMHIEHITASCNKPLNIMKCLCSTKWGSDPITLITLYRGLIRSRLDYGGFLYGSCSPTSFQKVEKIQYKAIRIAMGAMQSTPTNALQVEAGEEPIKIRFEFLGRKFFLKRVVLKNNPVWAAVHVLHQLNIKFKRYRSQPMFLDCFISILPYKEKIQESLMPSIFQSNLWPLYTSNLTVSIPSEMHIFKDNVQIINSIFNGFLTDRFHNFTVYYTDGSKFQDCTFSSFGVYSPTTNLRLSGRLPEKTGVFTSELVAIHLAISHAIANKYSQNVIFTDSESAIKAISSYKSDTHNYLIMNIKEDIIMASTNNISFKFCWIPSHKGIRGNEIADLLARFGRLRPLRDIPIPTQDLIQSFSHNRKNRWQQQWIASSSTKGKYYFQISPNVSYKPWFMDAPFLSRFFITCIARLKFNHNLTPAHLFKINIIDSPNCVCGEIGTANHLLFSCARLQDKSNQLISDLIKLRQYPPYDLNNLLATNSNKIYTLIFNFILHNKINV